MRIAILLGLTFLGLILQPASFSAGEEPPNKVAVPGANAQAEARKLVKEVYGKELAGAKTTDQKKALAEKLFQLAKENRNDLTGRFVLLRFAKDIAVQAADCETALMAIEEMVGSFQIDGLELKDEVLRKSAVSATSIDQHIAVAKNAAEVADEAAAKDNFRVAESLIDLAVGEARKAKDDTLVKRSSERKAEINGFAQAYVAVERARAALETSPVDPGANLTVGKYVCFAKNDWEHGLPLLALGNDPTLKTLGEEEVRGVASSDEQATLADSWWNAAEIRKGVEKKRMQERAAYWYQNALPGLAGLAKDKVAIRLRKLHEDLPVYLADLHAEEVRVAPGAPIPYKGKSSPHMLWAGPPMDNSSSHLAYHLDGRFRTMHGDVGICGVSQIAATPIIFRVVGDGKTLWLSKPLQKSEVSISFRVNVTNVKKLELFVDCPGIYNFAWALWIDPILEH
jgi:hypothetical protein